ncbi:hypothetical protein [Nocardia sp. NPDC057030]|uniref:hypothetical protein n=1 Tax=unclassified Nocardia TaxID=2637762 RepID=UPI003645762F
MTNPYGGPRTPAAAHSGLIAVITIGSAWLGAALACSGSFLAAQHYRIADRNNKPKVTDDAYDAWKTASDFHAVLEVLLIVSALMAVVLAVGSLLSMIGKPIGRPLEIIGGAWVFLGGLVGVTYGGDHGLAVGASFPAYLIIGGAALGLVALVFALTRPGVSPPPPAYIQQPPAPMHYPPRRP